MCECYSRVIENLAEHFQKQMPEGSKEFELELEGYVFGITDDGVTHRAANNAIGRFLAPKKGGGMKKQVVKTFVRATFCPFCGVKYE